MVNSLLAFLMLPWERRRFLASCQISRQGRGPAARKCSQGRKQVSGTVSNRPNASPSLGGSFSFWDRGRRKQVSGTVSNCPDASPSLGGSFSFWDCEAESFFLGSFPEHGF